MLRTGDLAVRRSDGRVDIVGRGGDRLKIRGFRVEPAEVEAVLRRMPNVADVAVGAVGDEPAVRLVAYVVVNAGEAWDANEAWAWSQAHLPSFMQPAEFVPVPAMPMTAGAKLDRRALAALSVDRAVGSSRASSSPESSATESTLRTIVQEVLQIDDVASGENFFALGGNSILGIQVLARVYDVWQLDLSPTALFDAPTVAELADVVDTALKERERTRASVVAGR
jgi:acyl carrier protein